MKSHAAIDLPSRRSRSNTGVAAPVRLSGFNNDYKQVIGAADRWS
jgi:hypothetical protein